MNLQASRASPVVMWMSCRGVICKWCDEKGYGFIRPDGGGEDVFVHIADIRNARGRAGVGVPVSYSVEYDERQRPRASHVWFPESGYGRMSPAWIVAALFFCALSGLCWLGRIPVAVAVVYPLTSVVTFCAYRSDKLRAERKTWRIRETSLHLLELLGGWPGAFVAQRQLRHKNRKAEYQAVFWMIVVPHLGGLVWAVSGFPNPGSVLSFGSGTAASPAARRTVHGVSGPETAKQTHTGVVIEVLPPKRPSRPRTRQ